MKSLSLTGDKDSLPALLDQALALDPSFLFFFAAPSFWRDGAAVSTLMEKTKGKTILGCSTAGVLGIKGFLKDGFSLLAVHLDSTTLKSAHTLLNASADSYEAGTVLAEQLKDPALRALFVFTPGRSINGTDFLKGMVSTLGPKVMISGGLAADELEFKETFTLCDTLVSNRHAVALGLYGDTIVVSSGSEGGWRPFGPARRVSKAEGNVLYELDGKPALQLYRQYLGDKARALPASGLAYPFAILRDDRTTSGIIRSALEIDHEREALILAGNIPQGCRVCLMHADTDALVQGAAQAAAEALRTHANAEENGCALAISCVGRRVTLGIDVDDEIEALTDSFLPETPLAGFYSYGEISTMPSSGRVELHNQTMSVTYMTEKQDGS